MNYLKNILRALKYRNYRLFFVGQGTSLIGTWIQTTAMSWLVYRITNSAVALGTVNFVSQIPVLLITPFGGVLADRFNLRRILILTNILSMIQAIILTILVLLNYISIWHIFLLAGFLGIVNSFDMPSRQAFVVKMVENKDDLSNAIALNSSMFNGARLIGPAVAGIIIARTNEGICFLINTLSFIAAIVVLFLMKLDAPEKKQEKSHVLRGLKDGLKYAFSNTKIKNILFLVASSSFFGFQFAVLLPIFAKDIFHGTSRLLGFMMASIGVGALAGAIYLASRKSSKNLWKMIPFATIMFGISIMLFSFSSALHFSIILLMFAGFGMIGQMVSSNTVIQTIVDDDKRGRVMSLFTTAMIGISPFGSLLAGFLASRIGAPNTLFIGGIICILNALIFIYNFRSEINYTNA